MQLCSGRPRVAAALRRRTVLSASEKGKSQEGEVTADKSGAKAKEAMDSFGDGEVEAGKKSAAEAAAKAAGAAETVAGKGAKRGAAVYTALATVLAAGAVALVAVPSAAQEAIYGSCGNSACDAFMRLSGVFTLLPVAALWSLKGAAENGRLSSETYERLNSSLLFVGLGVAALSASTALSSTIATTGFIWVKAAVGLITALAAGHVLARGDGGLVAVLGRVPSEAVKVFKPSGALSACYSALAVACALMASALLLAPSSLHGFLFSEAVSMGPMPVLFKRNLGILMVMAVSFAYTLKDAADRSRLGASTFKLLNLSMSAVCAGTLATLLWYVQNSVEAQMTAVSISMFVALAATCGLCGFQFATATK